MIAIYIRPSVNIDGKPGAVGFVSVLFPSVYPVALIKVDEDTREVIRDENGLCIRCKPGEEKKCRWSVVDKDMFVFDLGLIAIV